MRATTKPTILPPETPITKLRIRAGLSKNQLSINTGISFRDLVRIERGQNQAVMRKMLKIARELKCTLEELVG